MAERKGIWVLKAYRIDKGDLVELGDDIDKTVVRNAVWIDLCDGTDGEKALVEDALGIDVDPINDYEPFQVSSHFSTTE